MLSASSIQPSGDVDHDELPVCSSHSQSTGLHGEGERGTDADDEYDEKDGVWQDDDVKLLSRLNVSSSQRKQSCCHSNPCRGKKRPFAANTRFVPGMQVATEVCCTFTCATILWQVNDVPSYCLYCMFTCVSTVAGKLCSFLLFVLYGKLCICTVACKLFFPTVCAVCLNVFLYCGR